MVGGEPGAPLGPAGELDPGLVVHARSIGRTAQICRAPRAALVTLVAWNTPMASE